MKAQSPRRVSQRFGGVLLALSTLAVSAAAHAGDRANGECTFNGKTITFVDGVAYHRPYAFDAARQQTVVTLAPFMLDKAAVSRAEPKEKSFAVFRQAMTAPGGHAARLDVTVLDGKVVEMSLTRAASRMSTSAAGIGAWNVSAESAERIAGTFRFDGDEKDDLKCSATFELEFADGNQGG